MSPSASFKCLWPNTPITKLLLQNKMLFILPNDMLLLEKTCTISRETPRYYSPCGYNSLQGCRLVWLIFSFDVLCLILLQPELRKAFSWSSFFKSRPPVASPGLPTGESLGQDLMIFLGSHTWQNKDSFCLCLWLKVEIWAIALLFSLVFWRSGTGTVSSSVLCGG